MKRINKYQCEYERKYDDNIFSYSFGQYVRPEDLKGAKYSECYWSCVYYNQENQPEFKIFQTEKNSNLMIMNESNNPIFYGYNLENSTMLLNLNYVGAIRGSHFEQDRNAGYKRYFMIVTDKNGRLIAYVDMLGRISKTYTKSGYQFGRYVTGRISLQELDSVFFTDTHFVDMVKQHELRKYYFRLNNNKMSAEEQTDYINKIETIIKNKVEAANNLASSNLV